MSAWLIIAVVLAVLYGWWVLFRFSFGLIDRALEEMRAAEPSAEDGGKLTRERES